VSYKVIHDLRRIIARSLADRHVILGVILKDYGFVIT